MMWYYILYARNTQWINSMYNNANEILLEAKRKSGIASMSTVYTNEIHVLRVIKKET